MVQYTMVNFGEVTSVGYRDEIAACGAAERENWQVFDCVDSTNLVCKRWALEDVPDGAVAIAGEQTAGRGRLGRSFQSRPGVGLYLSILWRPGLSPQQLLPLRITAAYTGQCQTRHHTGTDHLCIVSTHAAKAN